MWQSYMLDPGQSIHDEDRNRYIYTRRDVSYLEFKLIRSQSSYNNFVIKDKGPFMKPIHDEAVIKKGRKRASTLLLLTLTRNQYGVLLFPIFCLVILV